MAEGYNDSSQQYGMSPEDQYRVTRLYEEIRGRLVELATIGARVLGLPFTNDMVIKFDPGHEAARQRSLDVDVEIICRPPEIGGACACIYRGQDGQMHWESVCGTTSF